MSSIKYTPQLCLKLYFVSFFLFQYVRVAPNQGEVVKGLFIPWCENCDKDSIMQVKYI